MANLISTGNINLQNLTPEQQANITSLETKAGLPAGITASLNSNLAPGVNPNNFKKSQAYGVKAVTGSGTSLLNGLVKFGQTYSYYDPITGELSPGTDYDTAQENFDAAITNAQFGNNNATPTSQDVSLYESLVTQ